MQTLQFVIIPVEELLSYLSKELYPITIKMKRPLVQYQ